MLLEATVDFWEIMVFIRKEAWNKSKESMSSVQLAVGMRLFNFTMTQRREPSDDDGPIMIPFAPQLLRCVLVVAEL